MIPTLPWGPLSTNIRNYYNHVCRYKSNIFKLTGLKKQDKISSCTIPNPKNPSSNNFVTKIIKLTRLNRGEPLSYGPIPNLNILILTIILNNTFTSPRAKYMLYSYRNTVWLCMSSYSTNIPNIDQIEYWLYQEWRTNNDNKRIKKTMAN